ALGYRARGSKGRTERLDAADWYQDWRAAVPAAFGSIDNTAAFGAARQGIDATTASSAATATAATCRCEEHGITVTGCKRSGASTGDPCADTAKCEAIDAASSAATETTGAST